LIKHGDGIRLMHRFAKDRGVLRLKIFVDFELQALVSKGRSTVPSRASSAAHASAAAISLSIPNTRIDARYLY
jgi:hypothetical protein